MIKDSSEDFYDKAHIARDEDNEWLRTLQAGIDAIPLKPILKNKIKEPKYPVLTSKKQVRGIGR